MKRKTNHGFYGNPRRNVLGFLDGNEGSQKERNLLIYEIFMNKLMFCLYMDDISKYFFVSFVTSTCHAVSLSFRRFDFLKLGVMMMMLTLMTMTSTMAAADDGDDYFDDDDDRQI